MSKNKEQLIEIVGSDHVRDDLETLNAYSRDHSFATPRRRPYVVGVSDGDQVHKIVQWANRTLTPLVPISSGPPHFRGDTVPSDGGSVVIDLSGMKGIKDIDPRNRVVIVEPGVTYNQLQPELAKQDLRLSMPLLPRCNKSVVASLVEREPTLIPKYRWWFADPLRCLEVVWGNGDRMMTGDAGDYPLRENALMEDMHKRRLAMLNPRGPAQVDYVALVQAAQGTMGIVTWAALKCETLPKVQKLLFMPSNKLDDLLGFAYRILRFRYGDETLLLNRSNLAYIVGEETERVNALKHELPPWVLILNLCGRDILPGQKVEFLERDIINIAYHFNLQIVASIPGVRDGELLQAISSPSREPYWKLDYKGGCQDIFFLTTLDRTPELAKTMCSMAESLGFDTSDVGVYIQPVHQGVACHCEFNLPFDPGSESEVSKIKEIIIKASDELMKRGAFFSRPYGVWADMVYMRDAQTAKVLKEVKKIFDHNNVMNPGKLCF